MIKRLDCVSNYVEDLEGAVAFYTGVLGLREKWRIPERHLVGLAFPDGGADLVLHDNAERKLTEVEFVVDDVQATYAELGDQVTWIEPPFRTESGHVAVMRVPDGNVYVLISA